MAGVNKRNFLDGPPFKLSTAQELEVVRLHEEGVSNAELGICFGVSARVTGIGP